MIGEIVIDTKEAEQMFRGARDQIPLAVSHAMSRLVYEVAVGENRQGVLRKETDRALDKGAERFTLSGFQYRKATKRDLVAEVIADFTGSGITTTGLYKKTGGALKREYLRTILNGGTVKPPQGRGRTNLLEPITSNVKLNKHGNLTPKKFETLRKQAAVSGALRPGNQPILAGSKSKPKLKIAKRGKKKGQAVGKAAQYFWGYPKNREKSEKNYGLWERMGRNQKNPYGTRIRKIVMAGRKSRKQKRLVQGREISFRYIQRNYKRQFLRSLAMAMRTSYNRSRLLQSFDERRMRG